MLLLKRQSIKSRFEVLNLWNVFLCELHMWILYLFFYIIIQPMLELYPTVADGDDIPAHHDDRYHAAYSSSGYEQSLPLPSHEQHRLAPEQRSFLRPKDPSYEQSNDKDVRGHENSEHKEGQDGQDENLVEIESAPTTTNTVVSVVNETENFVKFRRMVDAASKLLKADKPFNGDDALSMLESIGKIIMDIIPSISNKRLAGDVYQSAKDFIRGSILLKQAWENWEDCDPPICQILVSLGGLYINVVSTL
jgi:hypothetical protein